LKIVLFFAQETTTIDLPNLIQGGVVHQTLLNALEENVNMFISYSIDA
jgi:hypothetical protein